MAKLSAYGRTEIGTVYKLTSAKRYMSDGTVLKNIGFGWKVAGKVKPGFTPKEAYEGARQAKPAHCPRTLLILPITRRYIARRDYPKGGDCTPQSNLCQKIATVYGPNVATVMVTMLAPTLMK